MMKEKIHYVLFLVMVGTILAGWFIGSGSAAPKTPPPAARVAVVDIVKVFNEYQRTKEINERLNKEQVDLQNQRKQKIDRVEALKSQLDSLHPDSKDYFQREKELLEASVDLKNFSDIKTEEVKREFRVLTEDIYKEMLQAIESVARESGYDLVLYLDLMDIRGDSFAALLEKIRERKVLYSAPQIDITTGVLEFLNQRYKLRSGASDPAEPVFRESSPRPETPKRSGQSRRK